jgi:hypothetical protein
MALDFTYAPKFAPTATQTLAGGNNPPNEPPAKALPFKPPGSLPEAPKAKADKPKAILTTPKSYAHKITLLNRRIAKVRASEELKDFQDKLRAYREKVPYESSYALWKLG